MNKEQLKEAVDELNLVDTVFEYDGVSYIDTAVSVMQVYDLIDQLDEPEVLSQEWIEEHRKSYTMEDSVEISELQNLLVPKQELPVIPKYVADWIEDLKSKKINLLENIYDFTHEEDIYNYIREQGNELMRAWLDGYEVEEVKRYIVEIGRKNVLWAENGRFKILPKDYYILDDKHYHILTRAEIENYDASLMEFAKEVAE